MSTITIELSIDDTNLVLQALGQLPFVKVYELIGRIQAQAAPQVQAAAPATAEQSQEAQQ